MNLCYNVCTRRPADVNLADTDGMTPLMHAVKTNDVDVALRLMHKSGELPKGPSIKEVCTEGWQTY